MTGTHFKGTAALAAALLLVAAPGLRAEAPTSDVKPTEQEARAYCEGAAEKMQVLAEDMESYMTECIGEYLTHPPGDLGVSPERGGTGY